MNLFVAMRNKGMEIAAQTLHYPLYHGTIELFDKSFLELISA